MTNWVYFRMLSPSSVDPSRVKVTENPTSWPGMAELTDTADMDKLFAGPSSIESITVISILDDLTNTA